ncbi:MAG: NADH-quinone oxidoreductase subunit C [Candidatus Gastranaerophilales bacterium]|nr:NADH-quinone oxidoreductase subunit C [Candidatus Gastranaerophilales bacterium]
MLNEFLEMFAVDGVVEVDKGINKYYLPKNQLKDALKYLKNTSECSFDMLLSLTAVELSDCIELVYFLYSSERNENLAIATKLSVQGLVIETVSDLYPSANWDEREIFDLFGVDFLLHSNLKRLLMPVDWKGHPLRKDYVMNDERLAWNK